MRSELAILVLLGLIIGGVVGYFYAYTIYTPQIEELSTTISDQTRYINTIESSNDELSNDVADLTDQIEELISDLSSLSAQYESLDTDHSLILENYAEVTGLYEDLAQTYNNLEYDYASLQSDYNMQVSEYDQIYSNLQTLSNDVLELYDALNSYVSLEEAIPRVMNYDEIEKISNKIISVTGVDQDRWDGYYKIHLYVRDDVDYVYDAEIPIINSYTYSGSSYSPIITGFERGTSRNIVQSLEYTVDYEQGDCDDQAILEYCMIQYYREHLLDVSYSLYLAHLTFHDDSGHVAIFLPSTEGRICILDPAGNYQTGSWYYVTAEDADRELIDYNDHWDEYGGIEKIKLYSIDINSGDYDISFEGSLFEAMEFFTENF